MTNINFAPIIGSVLLVGAVAGFVLHYVTGADATMIVALGLSLLGIHDSNVKLGSRLGAR